MSDLRATERLLEVIYENVRIDVTESPDTPANKASHEILRAIEELRRRGDTLVRADDLRRTMEIVSANARVFGADTDLQATITRLENALGGKMR